MKDLKRRLGLGTIDQETYELTYAHLNEQILKISKELNTGKVKLSNLDRLIKNSLKKLENINKIWGSSGLQERRILQKTMFPEGIYYDAKNNQYLTRKSNKFIELIASISSSCESIKKRGFSKKY